MTGKRLLIQVLGWDYYDLRPRAWGSTQNNTTKKWSKKVRLFLKKEFKKELNNY